MNGNSEVSRIDIDSAMRKETGSVFIFVGLGLFLRMAAYQMWHLLKTEQGEHAIPARCATEAIKMRYRTVPRENGGGSDHRYHSF